jgi:hypothetical protein
MATAQTKWRQEKIAIKNLSLWDENARFPEEYFKKPEKELISYFLKNKKFKIEELAEEIIEDFDIPQFEPLLVLNVAGGFIVLEGNRRLTAYKLLSDPSLTDNQEAKIFFDKLSTKLKINDDFALVANITDDIVEAQRYIDRKHNKGNNEVSWTSVERGHFAVRRKKGINKDVFKVEMSREVKALDLPDEIKFAVLGKGYETTFWRIVENPAIREKLGYSILEDGKIEIKDTDKFRMILKVIVHNVWNKEDLKGEKINSRDLNKSEEIADYSKRLNTTDAKTVDSIIEKGKEANKNLFGEKPVVKQGSGSVFGGKQNNFKSLIDPKILLPKVASQKIKEVFKELQLIEVSPCPTATFALVRIITDVTIKIFLELKGCKLNELGHLIITNGNEGNKKELKEKMNFIASNYLTGDLKPAVVALNEDLLTQNLNQVMHNAIFCASEKQIRDFWKNLFPFLEFLWGEIIKIESKK